MNIVFFQIVREKIAALMAAPSITARYEHLVKRGAMSSNFRGVFPGILWLQAGENGLAFFIGAGNPPHEADSLSSEISVFETELGLAVEKLLGGKKKIFLSMAFMDVPEFVTLFERVAVALPGVKLPEAVVVYVPQERDARYFSFPADSRRAGQVIKGEVFSRLGINPSDVADVSKPLTLPEPATLNLLIRDAAMRYSFGNGNDSECYLQGRKAVMQEYVRHHQLVYMEEDNKVFGYADKAGYIPKKGVYFSECCIPSGSNTWSRCIFATPRAVNAVRAGMGRQRREHALLKAEMRKNPDHPERRKKVVAAPFVNWHGLWKTDVSWRIVTGPQLLSELQRRQALLCGPEPLLAFEPTSQFEVGTGRTLRHETPPEELAQRLLVVDNGIVGAMGYWEKGSDPDPDPERMLKEGGLEECHRAFRWLIEEVQRRWQAYERKLVEVTSELRRVARAGIVPHSDYRRLCGDILKFSGLEHVVAFKMIIVVGMVAYLPDVISQELLVRLESLAPSYDESKGHRLGEFDQVKAAEELPADIAELLGVPVKRVPYVPVQNPEPHEWVI